MSDLKLLAHDTEDLEVISAHLQDAVVRVADMGYAKADRRFALMVNRFAWEEDTGRDTGKRKRTAVHFDYVDDAKVAGIDQNAQEGVLELLSITFEEKDSPRGTVTLSFAGGGTVKLDVDCLDAHMRDLGAAWAAKARPAHQLADKNN